MRKVYAHARWWLLAGLLFGGSSVTGVMLSKEAEHRFLPVVSGVTITRSQPNGDGILIWGTFDKLRDCRFVEATTSSGAVQLDLEFWDSHEHRAATRSIGLQAFGPWRISPSVFPVQLIVRHECHPLWFTSTTMLESFAP